MLIGFKDFLNNILIESLHPELKSVLTSNISSLKKHTHVVSKIKELSSRGEKTGIEGNMPTGSSRAYLQHAESHQATVDGKPASFKVGTKVAIHSHLDNHHDKFHTGGLSLGEAQNYAEHGDHYINSQYRILHPHDNNSFTTNHSHGIFPPLVDHDEQNHQWSTVGHARDIKHDEFKSLTKTASHPEGISHTQFSTALVREYNKSNGKQWADEPQHAKQWEHVTAHPLVQKFLQHQQDTGSKPHDYGQIGNMGVFEHPNGSKHIVARDHGWSDSVSQGYAQAKASMKASTEGHLRGMTNSAKFNLARQGKL